LLRRWLISRSSSRGEPFALRVLADLAASLQDAAGFGHGRRGRVRAVGRSLAAHRGPRRRPIACRGRRFTTVREFRQSSDRSHELRSFCAGFCRGRWCTSSERYRCRPDTSFSPFGRNDARSDRLLRCDSFVHGHRWSQPSRITVLPTRRRCALGKPDAFRQSATTSCASRQRQRMDTGYPSS
jgi:hypothetical protein